MRGNAHLAELLSDHSKDIDQLYGDNNQESLLHLAIREDDEEMVKVLIHFRANLNKASTKGFTPLGLAVNLSQPRGTAIAKMLVKAGASPYTKTAIPCNRYAKFAPLHIACLNGNFEFVKFLVEEIFTQSSKIFRDYCKETSSEIVTPSSTLNEPDNKQMVLVEEKDNSMTSKSRRKAKHKSRAQRLKHLLNQATGDGSTPLFMAVCSRHLQMVEYLIKAGAEPHFACLPGNLFHAAVQSRSLHVVKKSFEMGCDVNHRNSDGDTPLHRATFMNLPEVCELLLTGGAELNTPGGFGRTPLFNSMIMTYNTTGAILIQHGADFNTVDFIKSAALDRCLRNDETTMKFLLLAGARITTEIFTERSYKSLVKVNPTMSSWIREYITQPWSLRLSVF
ncbi:hypothetical protein C0Q70_13102 [Pomacea canaliculata]|uniref:Uncharacterized protein n=2 Tax=Pomacea canaliculata TaxID=400727 RepID=A0A2T7NWC4_POMCA|nr:hypothetical protein C0Q70_13102 [Pomacea canaliculata]